MAKALPTAAQVADKYGRNLGNSIITLKEGVDRVTESPMEKAALNPDGYLIGVQQNVEKWQTNLRKTTLVDWKESMKGKGANNLSASIPKAKLKMQDAMTKLLPYIAEGQNKVEGMPSLSRSDNKARMNEWFDHMSAYKA